MVNNKHVAVVATFALLGVTNGFVPAARLNTVQLRPRSSLRMADATDPLKRAEQQVNKVDARLDDGTRVEAREVVTEAPIVKERIHERTVEVDKTKIEEERIRTEVVQKVQPIKDERREQQDLKKIDHGLEVNEHGKAGLDKAALDELERRRQEVVSKAGTERDATTEHISERPDVVKSSKTNVVEQVVPVIERDVYVPHRVEHEKQIKEIIHQAPVIKDTIVEETITKEEFEKQYGTKVVETAASHDKTATSELRKSVTAKTEVKK